MSVFKHFRPSDIIVSPFEVKKSFTFRGTNNFTSSNVGIDRFLGQNITSSFISSSTQPTTGHISTQYQQLVYNSVKQLYYTNFLTSSWGDVVNTASIFPGKDRKGDTLVGYLNNTQYNNFNQSDLTFPKYFHSSNNATIGVISIPSKLYGNKIEPKSFKIVSDSGSIFDDGEGNLLLSSSLVNVGNIFYSHGLAIITGGVVGGYGVGIYGLSLYGGISISSFVENFVTSSNVTCSFSSSFEIYETQYKCTIRENEFNYSLNPSIISGSADGTTYNFTTGSFFSPYVTTVGLYNDNQELLAVAKLSQPLPTSPTTDTNIIINIDR